MTSHLHDLFTTGGLQFHWLDYDAPAIFGTPFRIRSQLIFVRNIAQHYYSIGERALDDLTFTGAGRQYRSFSTYTRDLRQVQPGNTALTRYNEFDLRKPLWIVSVERTFLDGVLRPLAGLGFSYADVHDYTGDTVRGR